MAPVILDTDVASSIIKSSNGCAHRSPKLIGKQEAITLVTIGELTKWSVMRNWGTTRRTALDRWIAARPPIPFTEEVARTSSELSGYADKRGRPRPVNAHGSQPAA
jgi:toxin FitB